MRLSSCAAVMLLLCFSAGMPAVARAENDTHSITQRIGELRNRLDSFCGIAGKNVGESSKQYSGTTLGLKPSVAKETRDASAVAANSSDNAGAKSIDGESEKSSESITPEGESSAIEHCRNVKMTVLFHDTDASAAISNSKKGLSESPAKAACAPPTTGNKFMNR